MGCFGSEPQNTSLKGKPLPPFKLLLTDSITLLSNADLPSNKSIVFFYLSPFCPYCKAQTKEIIEDLENLKNIQFYFITNFPLNSFKPYCKDYQLERYPNIIAAMDTANTIADYFEITNVPFIAVFKKNKTLHNTYVGKIYSGQLKKIAEQSE